MKNIKKLGILCIITIIILSAFACAKKIESYDDFYDIDNDKIITETKENIDIVDRKIVIETTKETTIETTKETIIETTEIIKEPSEENINEDIDEEEIDENNDEQYEGVEKEEGYGGLKEDESEDCLEKHLSLQEALSSDNFKYGMTPIKWVYVNPNKQLVSNNKPKSSQMFSISKKATSGEKGCFVPIYTQNTKNATEDYEARILCFEDTTRDFLEFRFLNRLGDIEYRGQTISQIYQKGNIEYDETDNGILIVNGEFVNVIYVEDLDKILGIQ